MNIDKRSDYEDPALPNEKPNFSEDYLEDGPPSQNQLLNKKNAGKRARGAHFIVVLVLSGLILRHALWNVLLLAGSFLPLSVYKSASQGGINGGTCPQAPVLIPANNGELWGKLGKMVSTDVFSKRAVDWLGGAVRIPTPSYDQMDAVGVDPRWDVFAPFHEYLEEAYPLIHKQLEVVKVNTYGLAYIWKGSDETLKPILLLAHQDVVPVDKMTEEDWTFPPWSGHDDGKRLWGRGSSDDKSGLIAVMSAVETLIENHFKPTRGVVLAFGFDEEASGVYGARRLSEFLLDRFQKNAFALLVDEGTGFAASDGAVFATPGIAEKGYLDVKVEVTSPGGHSSVPPEHTSIGMLAKLLVNYEANPYDAFLTRGSPVYKQTLCFAEHAPAMDYRLKKLIKSSLYSDVALKRLEAVLFERSPFLKSLVGTTQAIDVIQGGVKSNALPENAWAIVNHRINTESSIGEVKAHDTALLRRLAYNFNLTYDAFGYGVSGKGAPTKGTLTLSDAWGTGLEPAPVTPTGESPAFKLLSGTIKSTYNAHRSLRGDDTIKIAPSIMSGNTDTRYYWDLTKHIFRYAHVDYDAMGVKTAAGLPPGIHTVNEYVVIDSYLEMIRFYITLILNADESKTLG